MAPFPETLGVFPQHFRPMKFSPFAYMSWAKARFPRPRFDLAVSGMAPPGPDLLPLDDSLLTLHGVSPVQHRGLREDIARTYGVSQQQVLLANGTSEANYLVAALLLSPGDRVLVETPAYEVLGNIGALFGAETGSFSRYADDGFAFRAARVVEAWQPATRLVILTTPHNPSGACASAEELAALGAHLDRHDAYALVDEVYRDFQAAPGPVAAVLHPRLITTASLTKVYGLGAIRVGWALAPADLVARGYQYYDYMGVNQPTISLCIAQAGLARLEMLRHHALHRARENAVLVQRFLDNSSHFAGTLPEAGIIAFLRATPAIDTRHFAEWLCDHYQTLVAPGDFFGLPGFVRLGFGGAAPDVEEGLRRLEAGLADYLEQMEGGR
jgi:aspartate/methionine/tyrosine aminotransferase